MKPASMTVEQVREELSRDDVAARFLRACARDPRIGVREAVRATRHRLAAIAAEQARLEDLYRIEAAHALERGVLVGGLDEVGRGPLAGPVMAACVILPSGPRLEGLDDSKRLTPEQREHLDGRIREVALGVGLGIVGPEEIDRLNIRRASLEAMRLALAACAPARPGFLLLDAFRIPGCPLPQEALIGGDGKCACIAAASIVAKVARDRLMVELDERFPGYAFAEHKGYSTPTHLAALQSLGPSPIHRRSFAPCARQATLFDAEAAGQDGGQ